jgi:anti-sigma regulatory factor (Ser/Thr protein kinase)/ABC-type transporter Mla MlaB component
MSERVHQQKAQPGQRYTTARDEVTRLAEALLPPALPVLPQAQIAARYLPAEGECAGGDWFDAVPLADGTVALAVGDVAGHGVAALATMGQLRAVLGELLATEPQLDTVLARVDAFAARTPGLPGATLALAVLDPADGTLRHSTCGHPPPLVISARGTTRYLPATGTGPLGTGSPPILATGTLPMGELVLLYTDGLIRRPGRSAAEGMAELAAAAASAAGQPSPPGTSPAPADRVCQLTTDQVARSGYDDDIITLAAQRLAHPIPALDLSLPAQLTSLTAIRHALGEWLDRIDPAAQERDDLQLAVGEIVTNVIEHAYPPGQPGLVELRAALAADGNLQCQITDYGHWRQPDPAARDRGHGLMVATQVVDQMLVSHPGQAAGAARDVPGTTVTLRCRLHRPVISGPPNSSHIPSAPPPPSFAVDIGIDETFCRARVSGPVDDTTATPLARRLLTASRGGTMPLTVDLTGVTRLGSAGTRSLYQVRRQLANHLQQLTLVAAAGSSVALILDLAHLPYITTAPPGSGAV